MFQSLFFRKIFTVFLLTATVTLQAYALSDNTSAESLAKDIISVTEIGENGNIDSIHKKADSINSLISPKAIMDALRQSAASEFSKVSSVFAGMFALILLSALFTCMGDSFSHKNGFSFISVLLAVLITLHPVTNIIELTKATCDRLSAFMLSFIPAISAMSAAGGNTVSASTGAILCSSGLAFLEILSSRLLIPATKICVSLCAVSAVGKGADLSPVSSFIKNTCMWISGLIMTIFCGVLSLQTFISTGADSLAMKGIKFTAAKLIPVAGGMVSESLKTVVAGAGYVKSVAGTAAIAYIIYSVMPTVCGILAVKLLFYVSGLFASLSGQKELQSYLVSASSALNLLYSVCAVLCASFIIMLAIFIKTAVSV